MTPKITDIWFRSPLRLAEIARRLGLQDITEDAENHWAWAIGSLGKARLDITRAHAPAADQTDTRIFLLGAGEFKAAQVATVVGRLRAFVPGAIACGRWEYRSGDDFDRVVVREFGPTAERSPE